MNEKKKLQDQATVEMDAETHQRVLAEVQERYTGPLAALSILQEIRADQIKSTQETKSRYGRIADSLGEQNAVLNRLSTDVAGLSIRTAALEVEQQKHAALLGQVKERQDGCAARITHGDDTTEIRDLRTQLQKAVSRKSTPPRGIKHLVSDVEGSGPASGGWWASPAGKAVLTALAGLLVALASALTTWATMSPSGQPAARQAPPMTSPAESRAPDDGADFWPGD